MSQSGFTPFQLYYSTTSGHVPTTGNLQVGELAINIADGVLFYNNGTSIAKIASNATAATTGTSILYGNGSGGFSNVTVGTGLSFSGGVLISTVSPGSGTVTSVSGTGSANGLSLSGTVTSSGNITLSGNVNSITTTDFTVQESGGKLVIKYGSTTLFSIDSSGNMTTIANVTAYGTP